LQKNRTIVRRGHAPQLGERECAAMPGGGTGGLIGRQRETKTKKNDDRKKSALSHKITHSQKTTSASEILMCDALQQDETLMVG
jgi:hypothetical protein